ncbi:MAG: hypothetical protein MJ250_06920 [Alphaproteobacteria bacterium]|nr:hypothetical protein [Alphaproteobacteria bacterium]
MLSLETETKQVNVDEKLKEYLSGSLAFIGNVEKEEAKNKAEEYGKETDMSAFVENRAEAKAAVKAAEKKAKATIKAAPLRDKIDYATDSSAYMADPMKAEMNILNTALCSLISVTAAGIGAASGDAEMGCAAGLAVGAIAAYNFGKVAVKAKLSADNEEEKASMEKFVEAKHTLLALKQIKRAIKAADRADYVADVEKIMANYGNPSGGMTHFDARKEAADNLMTPVSEKKSSYMDEVAKLMAAGYGQPSGGLVQKPTEEVKLEVKAEEPKKRSSFMESLKEGWELMGAYGNPSGGLVHKDVKAEEAKATEPAKEEPKKRSSFIESLKEGWELMGAYGNPSGGLVHKDVKTEDAKVAEPAKEEKKSSWKEMVSKIFAMGYGQPSGGLVQKPFVQEEVKTVKPAKEEKKSSYMDEVKNLMAAGYGQPSGGLVQAALNKKKMSR